MLETVAAAGKVRKMPCDGLRTAENVQPLQPRPRLQMPQHTRSRPVHAAIFERVLPTLRAHARLRGDNLQNSVRP